MTRPEAEARLKKAVEEESKAYLDAKYGQTEQREKHFHALQAVISARLALEHSNFEHAEPVASKGS